MRFLTRRLRADHYCVLCHITLSDFVTGPSTRSEPGERHVYCVLRTISLDDGSEEEKGKENTQIFMVDLHDRTSTYGNELLTQNLVIQDAQLNQYHPNCRGCDKEGSVNFVHVHCLALARKRLPDMPAEMLLSQMFRLTRPILPWDQRIAPIHPTLPYHPLGAQLSRDTELGRLVATLEDRLPVELQKMIFDNSSGIFRSLLNCSSTIHDCLPLLLLLGKRSLDPSPRTSNPLSEYQTLETIEASTVNVLGEACFVQIGANQGTVLNSGYQIPIARHAVSGIEVAEGTHGIVGMRILYLNGSKSPWLGGSKHAWITTVSGNDLKDLQIRSDGVKIVSMELQKSTR